MEVEAKFLVPDEATLARLIEAESLAGYSVAPGEPATTPTPSSIRPDRRLLTARYYFRRRETKTACGSP